MAADPLVTVAAILIRMLREASNGTVESAIALTRPYVDTEIVPADQLQKVELLITELISGFRARSLQEIHHGAIAMIAHDIAIGAATEISAIDSRHISKVVADLRVQLKEQSDHVQISDRDGSMQAAIEYAADDAMRKARETAALQSADYWHKAAYDLHIESLREDISSTCQDSLEALALVGVTTKSLAAGTIQLVRCDNIYPAWTLLRQIVEAEFVFWKFSQDIAQSPIWLHSTSDERRRNWKPWKIYRDDNNDYRQMDYSIHCERGGHPTPDGARIASQGHIPSLSRATLLSEMTDHLWDAWKNLVDAMGKIDSQCNIDMSARLAPIGSAYVATMKKWKSVDHLRHAVAFFSDPID